ncbi:MAG: hypothetical protein J6S85_17595 [Methanobrevibacter sp.]|nr:hypothetical protein [Methanobrevibacter sp.]
MIKEILPVFQLAVSICTLLGMFYAFKKFIERPHDNLESRVIALELKQKETDQKLHQGNDRFKKQDDTNEVFINCMLAFIDFELSYCSHTDYKYTEDLDKAKDTLRKHLAKARG